MIAVTRHITVKVVSWLNLAVVQEWKETF